MLGKALAIVAIIGLHAVASTHHANASEGACGWYAFGGAFKNKYNANRQARRVGGQVFDLDQSDSPNAGKGFWVVGAGPGNRGWARKKAKRFRRNGANGAYAAARCMY